MVEPVSVLVEGPTDEPALVRLLEDHGLQLRGVFGRRGKSWIDANIAKYNAAAQFGNWLVLRDLDADEPCAPDLVRRLLPQPAARMRFRVAVHQLEAWLLGDRNGASRFFGISRQRVPADPEGLTNAKRAIVDLCRQSTIRRIREGMVPQKGSTASVGPEYGGLLTEFSLLHWDWRAAAATCDSLRRTIVAIDTFR